MYENTAKKSVTAMSNIYGSNHRVLVDRYSKTNDDSLTLFWYSGQNKTVDVLINATIVSSVGSEVPGTHRRTGQEPHLTPETIVHAVTGS